MMATRSMTCMNCVMNVLVKRRYITLPVLLLVVLFTSLTMYQKEGFVLTPKFLYKVKLKVEQPFIANDSVLLDYCTTRNQTVDLYDSSNSNIPQIYPGQKLPPTSPEVWQRAEKYMALTQEEYDKYLHLLDTTAHFFYKYNITFVISEGTLLGSYMFHDLIPWDEDIDINISFHDYKKLKTVVYRDPEFQEVLAVTSGRNEVENEYSDKNLLKMYPEIVDKKTGNTQYHKHKIFFKGEEKTFDFRWRWPFLDVIFIDYNDTHVWKVDDRDIIYHPYEQYFPLHPRPLGGRWYPAPADSRLALRIKYRDFRCQTHDYNHKTEKPTYSYRYDCAALKKLFPYVERRLLVNRTKGTQQVVEERVMDDHVLYRAIIDESNPVCLPPMTLHANDYRGSMELICLALLLYASL